MGFQPNQEYAATISSYSMVEDNNGNAEIHIGVSQGTNGTIFKLKFKTSAERKRSMDFAVRFGADREKLSTTSYLEQWGNGLSGRPCHIRTKTWEMGDRSGVYISQISTEPFPPANVAIAKAFGSIGKGDESQSSDDDSTPF